MDSPDDRPIRTALFIDFDNIYIGLQDLAPDAAKAFATNPSDWLSWIESGMPTLHDYGEHTLPTRKLLVRRCYLNPAVMRQRDFRAHFLRAGFSVVDCPAVTAQGKNNADILMVMDILDAIDHPTRFEEFIILSGDSDFTPVLLRLRTHDRRTAIITAGPAAEAYRAAADRAIAPDLFIECGLGLSTSPDSLPLAVRADVRLPPPGDALLDRMAAAVYNATMPLGELSGAGLSSIFMKFSEFRDRSDWLGFRSMRNLTLELVRRRSELTLVESDPWKVGLAPAAAQPANPAGTTKDAEPGNEALRAEIVKVATEMVERSAEAQSMAAVAHEIIRRFPMVLTNRWAGCGTFKGVLQKAQGLPFEILTAPGAPGYLVDRSRHAMPALIAPEARWLATAAPELADFIRQVHQVTDAPPLPPAQYQLLFEIISKEVQANGYNVVQTSKVVRDQCMERGQSIARSSVSFVLRGIAFGGHKLGASKDDDVPVLLAEAFRRNVENLCRAAQFDLSESQALLKRWITSGTEPGEAKN